MRRNHAERPAQAVKTNKTVKTNTGFRPERRQYPRVDAQLCAELKIGDQVIQGITVINLSRVGLMVACDRISALTITPGGYVPSGPGVELQISFSLPPNEFSIRTRCRLMNSRRWAQDEFHLGFQFLDFQGQGYKLLNDFVVNSNAVPA